MDAEDGELPGKAKAEGVELSFQCKAGELGVVANIVHNDVDQSKKPCTL